MLVRQHQEVEREVEPALKTYSLQGKQKLKEGRKSGGGCAQLCRMLETDGVRWELGTSDWSYVDFGILTCCGYRHCGWSHMITCPPLSENLKLPEGRGPLFCSLL